MAARATQDEKDDWNNELLDLIEEARVLKVGEGWLDWARSHLPPPESTAIWSDALPKGLGVGDQKARQQCVDDTCQEGRLLLAECYDDAGVKQGYAMLRVSFTEDSAIGDPKDGPIECEFIAATDGYYEHWAKRHLVPGSRAAYHISICGKAGAVKNMKGRAVVHLKRYSMLSIEEAVKRDWAVRPLFAMWKRRVRELIKKHGKPGSFAQDPQEEEACSPIAGLAEEIERARLRARLEENKAGAELLDGASRQVPRRLSQGDAARMLEARRKRVDNDQALEDRVQAVHGAEQGRKRDREGDGDEHRKPVKQRRESVSDRLHLQASAHHPPSQGGEAGSDQDGVARAPRERGDRRRSRSRRRQSRRSRSRGRNRSSSSRSRSSFLKGLRDRAPTARDIAEKHAGRIMRQGLEEMSKYLAGRAGAREEWYEVRVLAYLSQNVMKKDVSERNARELRTLAEVMDALIMGDLTRVGDIAMGRFQAIEVAHSQGGWDQARHLEVAANHDAVSVPAAMMDMAAKAELRSQQLRDGARKGILKWPPRRVHFAEPADDSWKGDVGGAQRPPGEAGPAAAGTSLPLAPPTGRSAQGDNDKGKGTLLGRTPKQLARSRSLSKRRGLRDKHCEVEAIDAADGDVASWAKSEVPAAGGRARGHDTIERGVRCWTALAVVQLNLAWGAAVETWPLEPELESHRLTLQHVCDTCRYFVMNKTASGEVPRSPAWDWKGKIAAKRVSYQGEILEFAKKLTLEQMLPGLPPPGQGGSIPIAAWCRGETLAKVRDPTLSMLPESEIPELPRARVQADDDEWAVIVHELFKRNLVKEVREQDIFHVRGEPVTAGAFGIVEAGKQTPTGLEVLRLIISLTPMNMCQRAIGGDVETMAGATHWMTFVLGDGEILLISGDDLVCSFYLFALPEAWLPYFALSKPAPKWALGGTGMEPAWASVAVLPMGWLSAVGVMQHAHPALLLERAGLPGELEVRKDRPQPTSLAEDARSAWHVYVDDSTELEAVDGGKAKDVIGQNGTLQNLARRAYREASWPFAVEKAVERAPQADRLGRHLDGDKGRIGVRTERILGNLSLACYLCSSEGVRRHWLQIYAAKEVHTLEMRRCLFSQYRALWASAPRGARPLPANLCDEMVGSLSLAPFQYTNLRAKLEPTVTASDASPYGAGVGVGVGDRLGAARVAMQALSLNEAIKLVEALPCWSQIFVVGQLPHCDPCEKSGFDQLAAHLEVVEVFRTMAVQRGKGFAMVLESLPSGEMAVAEINNFLGVKAAQWQAGEISRVERARLYWVLPRMPSTFEGGRIDYGEVYDEGTFEEILVPASEVERTGRLWRAGRFDPELRLPVVCGSFRRATPPRLTQGLASCSAKAKERWHADKHALPPILYEEGFMFEDPEGIAGAVKVEECEGFMGYPWDYTAAVLEHAAARAVPMLPQAHAKQGTQRAPRLPGTLLRTLGLTTDAARRTRQVDPQLDDVVKVPASWSIRGSVDEYIVESILRRVDHRGSDVRLDLGVLYRPCAWPRMSIDPSRWTWRSVISRRWRDREHINVLELRAALLTVRWRSRSTSFRSSRFVHLMDSQVALAVATKGRSSACILNRVLVKLTALLLALDVYPVYGYVATEEVGALADAVVTKGTLKRYENMFNLFQEFANSNNLDIHTSVRLDESLCKYIGELWEEGAPKADASYTYAALRHFYITSSPPLHGELCGDLLPGERLLQAVRACTFLRQFSRALEVLKLDAGVFSPYSLRRGGATFDFRSHGRMEKTLMRGRWQSSQTAKLYIQEGLANLAEFELTDQQLQLLEAA
ncbi:unnamed protein product, partial [Prorocentrum cordatum]